MGSTLSNDGEVYLAQGSGTGLQSKGVLGAPALSKPSPYDALDEYVFGIMAEMGARAAQLAVTRNGVLVLVRSYNFAEDGYPETQATTRTKMARRFCNLVFEDALSDETVTSPVWDHLLGSADRLSLQVIAENVSGTDPMITVTVEQSSDGVNWKAKNILPEIDTTLVPGDTNVLTGVELGDAPSRARVRLRVTLKGTAPQAFLTIYATGRGRA